MDKTYADTVRLLLAVSPDVFANDIFAMKGGTAINLFVRDMPRLSVDIDVVYLPWQTPRDEALQAINQEPQIQALCWFLDAMPGDNTWDAFSLTQRPGRLVYAAEEFDALLTR